MATILIVDDEKPVRELLAMFVEDVGHHALQAAHGRHALEIVAKEPPDLVIADIMMPVLGGVELCRRLKAVSEMKRIPVILMSSAGERLARGAGAQAFINKPFDLDDMEALIQHWLVRSA